MAIPHPPTVRVPVITVLCDLRDAPEFAAAVARQTWPRDHLAKARVLELLGDAPLPFAVVARSGAVYLGSVAVLRAGHLFSLWVEPAFRHQGLGHGLLRGAEHKAFAAGLTRLQLTAEPKLQRFYLGAGWHALNHEFYIKDRPG